MKIKDILERLRRRPTPAAELPKEYAQARENIAAAFSTPHGRAALGYWVENILCKPAYVPGDIYSTLINEGKRCAIHEILEIVRHADEVQPAVIVTEHTPT